METKDCKQCLLLELWEASGEAQTILNERGSERLEKLWHQFDALVASTLCEIIDQSDLQGTGSAQEPPDHGAVRD